MWHTYLSADGWYILVKSNLKTIASAEIYILYAVTPYEPIDFSNYKYPQVKETACFVGLIGKTVHVLTINWSQFDCIIRGFHLNCDLE